MPEMAARDVGALRTYERDWIRNNHAPAYGRQAVAA